MALYSLVVPTCVQLLNGLSTQIGKAESWAADNDMSSDDLMAASLTPDMLPLASQIRFVIGQARDSAGKLTAQDFPAAYPEDTAELELLKTAIDATIALLEGLTEDDFSAADDAMVELSIPNGMVFDLTRYQYARDWALPQIYFHAATAYAIMRSLGVELGKADFVGHMVRYVRMPAA